MSRDLISIIKDFDADSNSKKVKLSAGGAILENNIEYLDLDSELSFNNEVVSSVVVPDNLLQSGICKDFTCYNLEKWNYDQRKIYDSWVNGGYESSRGIATIDGNYLVAVTPKFGNVGDKIEVVLEDGTKINCIVADQKGEDAQSEYGHFMEYRGNNLVSIIEWEGCVGKNLEEIGSNIDISDWKNINVKKINNYGSYIE